MLRDAFGGWQRHQDGRLAAALAYYAVFALAPLLLVIIALLGIFLGPTNAQTQIAGQKITRAYGEVSEDLQRPFSASR